MNEAGSAKHQILEKIKNSTNILVTVSASPTVDELSAALGLTMLLNKLKKHATAVVSGDIPPAITFLDPEKTFESTVDSLRDFIIALDKEKADHLRYKVDGDVVKIFITPYRTTITSDDLDFSQGDYNVELVLALGVKDQDNLDTALTAHGRILHDATVVTIGIGAGASSLGSIDWTDADASSLSEMLVGLSDGLKGEKGLLDEQIATALMTGIVAATDRFSASNTTSRTMTIAAQLMAAGANQQLIATKLQEAASAEPASNEPDNADGTTDLSEGESTKLEAVEEPKQAEQKKKDDGTLDISHESEGTIDEVADEVIEKQQEEAAQAAEEALSEQLEASAPAAPAVVSENDLKNDAQETQTSDVPTISIPEPAVVDVPQLQGAVHHDTWRASAIDSAPQDEPELGGTLNATAEQAANDKRREEESDRNKTILSHDDSRYLGNEQPAFQAPINSINDNEGEPTVDLFASSQVAPTNQTDAQPTAYAPTIEPLNPMSFEPIGDLDQPRSTPDVPGMIVAEPTLADIDAQNRGTDVSHADTARVEIDQAFTNPEQSDPTVQQSASFDSLPPLPPMPDFSTLPPLPSTPAFDPSSLPSLDTPSTQPEVLGDILAPTDPSNPQAAPKQPPTNDPGQFRIPGQ